MALHCYYTAIEMCPTNALYYCKKSNCLFADRNYKAAIMNCRQALTIDKTFKYGYECMINICLHIGDVDGANSALEKLTGMCSNGDDYSEYERKCKQLEFSSGLANKCFDEKVFDAASMY